METQLDKSFQDESDRQFEATLQESIEPDDYILEKQQEQDLRNGG